MVAWGVFWLVVAVWLVSFTLLLRRRLGCFWTGVVGVAVLVIEIVYLVGVWR